MRLKKVLFKPLPAFTFMEMLIVLTIIGILLAVGLATYSSIQNTAMKKASQIEIRQYKIAVYNYKIENETVPESAEALLDKGYITKELYYDPWNQPYKIEYNAETSLLKIISSGPDKKFGTKDDIVEEEKIF